MTTLEDFDFMADPPKEEPPLDQHPDRTPVSKPKLTTNKDFAQAVLNVFDKLGREEWLLTQAQIDPKSYLNMLSKMIPKSIDAEDLQGLTLVIVDQYHHGDKIVHMPHDSTRSPALPASAARHGGGPAQLGQPSDSGIRTATSGNPINDVEVIDTYRGGDKDGTLSRKSD